MRRKLLVSAVLAILLLSPAGEISHATPTAPVIAVNEATKQCGVVILGDECSMCAPAAGWTILDRADPAYQTMSCPAGYTKADVPLDCKRSRDKYCCGGFSSRGDCTDLVINETQRACAFLPNERACGLPPGWSRKPANMPESNWACNFDKDTWVDNLACVTASATVVPVATVGRASAPQSALPIGGLALLGIGAAALAWLRRRK